MTSDLTIDQIMSAMGQRTCLTEANTVLSMHWHDMGTSARNKAFDILTFALHDYEHATLSGGKAHLTEPWTVNEDDEALPGLWLDFQTAYNADDTSAFMATRTPDDEAEGSPRYQASRREKLQAGVERCLHNVSRVYHDWRKAGFAELSTLS